MNTHETRKFNKSIDDHWKMFKNPSEIQCMNKAELLAEENRLTELLPTLPKDNYAAIKGVFDTMLLISSLRDKYYKGVK